MQEFEKREELNRRLVELKSLTEQICETPFWLSGNGKDSNLMESIGSAPFGTTVGDLNLNLAFTQDVLQHLGAPEPEYPQEWVCRVYDCWYPERDNEDTEISDDENLSLEEVQILQLVVLAGGAHKQIQALLGECREEMMDEVFCMTPKHIDCTIEELRLLNCEMEIQLTMLSGFLMAAYVEDTSGLMR